MEENYKNIDIEDLIIRHLLKECTREENALAENLLDNNEEAKRAYAVYSKIYDSALNIEDTYAYNTDKAVEKFIEKIAPPVEKKIGSKFKVLFISGAAAAVLLAALFLFKPKQEAEEHTVTIASGNEVISDTLPDGSVLTLNKNTAVTFKNLEDGIRHVDMTKGEAHFEVAHNARQPFVIQVKNATITVLGTKFNVNASLHDSISVTVIEGIVKVAYGSSEDTLAANEKALLSTAGNTIIKTIQPNLNDIFWKTRIIEFNMERMKDVVPMLEKQYGVHIEMDSSLQDEILTAKYSNQPIEAVLEIIGETFNAQAAQLDSSSFTLEPFD